MVYPLSLGRIDGAISSSSTVFQSRALESFSFTLTQIGSMRVCHYAQCVVRITQSIYDDVVSDTLAKLAQRLVYGRPSSNPNNSEPLTFTHKYLGLKTIVGGVVSRFRHRQRSTIQNAREAILS